MDDDARDLSAELGKPLPSELLALPAEIIRGLVTTVREAKAQQLAAIDTATDEAIAQLPMMLRGPAKKALGR